LIMVTELGSDGSSLDQIGLTIPILAKYTPLLFREKPPRVSLAD
jgi:hypothetical protein